MGTELNAEQQILLKEYEIGENLRDSYFKNSWVVTSIILPVSFGLVGVSFAEQLLALRCFALFPLMFASITLYAFWFFYIVRYAGYLKTIYKTLQEIEKKLGLSPELSLHQNIANEDKNSCFKKVGGLGKLNRVTGGLLIVIWLSRLAYAIWLTLS